MMKGKKKGGMMNEDYSSGREMMKKKMKKKSMKKKSMKK